MITRPTGNRAARPVRPALLAAAAVAGLGFASASHGANVNWSVADGDWAVASNWTPAQVPGPADLAFVNNAAPGSTAHVTTDVPDVFGTFVLNGNTLRVESGGDLNVTNNSTNRLDGLRIGDGFGQTTVAQGTGAAVLTGTGRLSAGGTSDGNFIAIGVDGGVGTLTQDSATSNLFARRDLIVGESFSVPGASGGRTGSVGTYNLSAGRAEVDAGWAFVGRGAGATGNFNLSGTGTLVVGDDNVANNPPTGARSDRNFNVGVDGGTGTATQTGGTLHVSRWGFVGRNGGNGTFNHSGGVHATSGWIRVGEGGGVGPSTGTYNLSGSAVLNIGQSSAAGSIGDNDTGDDLLVLGAGAGSTGTFTVADNAVANIGFRIEVGVDNAGGTMTQSGGTVNAGTQTTGQTSVGFNLASTGVYNMNGGTLNAGRILYVGERNTAVGTMTQTGGNVNVGADGLTLALEGGTTGTYNLQGGTLDLGGGPITDGPGTAAFNMTGGRLQNAGSTNFPFVHGGGTLAPGAGTGITTINGNYTEASPATLEIDLLGTTPGTGHDQLVVNGAVALSGNLDLVPGAGLAVGNSFIVLSNDSTDAITGNFTGRLDDTQFTEDGYTFLIDYQGGDGNDVLVSVVPEPATFGVLALAAGALALGGRRGRRARGV